MSNQLQQDHYKLNPKEKEWLLRFHREYLNADFKHGGKILHKKRYRKDIYNMNNRRQRDLFSRHRVRNNLRFLGDNVFSLVDKGWEF